MSLVKFLSREKLIEYLDEELRLFLNAKEIYEINQYGWLADGRPDPDYMGIAMWQTEPPISHSNISNITEPPEFPSFSQTVMERIFKTGLEFEELMKSARHSIGLTYLYHKDTDALSHCFSYHHSDTIMKLGMATDRLRELFIDAFSALTGFDIKAQDTSVPCSQKEQHHVFCRPFRQTRDNLAKSPCYYGELLDCVAGLLPLVEQISLNRIEGHDRGNEKFLAENHFSTTIDSITKRTYYREPHDSVPAGETVTHRISEWYKLLIMTSNQIFLAEYLIRNFDKKTPITSIALSH